MIYEYPQFRKLLNKSYYKILSDAEMIEFQIVGNKILIHHLKAEAYFEKAFIQDLLTTDFGRYQICDKSEIEDLEDSGK